MFTRDTLAVVLLLLTALLTPSVLAQSDYLDLDVDSDGDGILNRFDNCYIYPNPEQFDADSDGYGNVCDADLNNDGLVDFTDLSLFSEVIFTNYKPADFNEDGIVNFLDLRVFRNLFATGIPGPPIVMRWIGGSGTWHDASNWYPARIPRASLFEHAIIDTPADVVVTIEETEWAGARSLELDGNLVVCGFLSAFTTVTATGTLRTDCGTGEINVQEAINLGGRLIIDSGRVFTPSIRPVDETEPEIVIRGFSQLGVLLPATRFSTAVDIVIEPGARLLAEGDELFLDNASIHLRSEVDLNATLETNDPITGTGTIEFSGPADASAVGTLFSFGAVEFGPGIEVQIAPNAYAYFDSQVTNHGNIVVTDSATLFFDKFNLFYNTGHISCSNNGRLLEFESGFPSPGDSILFNNPGSRVTADSCTMTWPTRVINQAQYTIANSQITLPLIAPTASLVDITSSDITIQAFQPPVPSDFFIFDPANSNSVQLNGLFDLGDQTLTIDAEKWRFQENQTTGGALFEFGTLVSETPLTINAGARVRLLFVELDTEVTLEPSAELIVDSVTLINGDIRFQEPLDCDATQPDPAVLRLEGALQSVSNTGIDAISSAANGETACLSAEIVTDVPSELPDNIELVVSNASMQVYGEGQGSLKLKGNTSVTGANAELRLEQVTNSGVIFCNTDASLFASGTSTRNFENNGSIVSDDCSFSLSGYWSNAGSVSTLHGTLSLSSSAGAFAPGNGIFSTSFTDVQLNLDLDDLTTLNVFDLNGGTFTIAGSILLGDAFLDLNLFPANVQFSTGFELVDATVSGNQPLRLLGTTTLQNVVLVADTLLLDGAVVNILDQLTLDDAVLTIESDSSNGAPTTTTLQMNGAMFVSGTGTIHFAALGEDARSEVVQTVADMPISVAAGIELVSSSNGKAIIRAGANTGTLELSGPITVAGEQASISLESPTTLFGKTTSYDRGQLRIIDNTLEFSGPGSGLVVEVQTGLSATPGIVAAGAGSIDINAASLSLIPAPGYVLESDKAVTVMEHAGDAARLGEFANTDGAVIDGAAFIPDYSSPDVTIFRGPALEARAEPPGR